MFKSIFVRMLVTYLIIIFAVLIIMSGIVSTVFGSYLFEEKHKELESAAYKSSRLAEKYIKNEIPLEELNTAIDSMGLLTESSIYIVKVNKEDLLNRNISEEINEPFIAQNIEKVLGGSSVYIQNQYSSRLEMNVIFIGYPLKADFEIIGAVLLFSPISSVNEIIVDLNTIIWLAALIILVISILIIYFNALIMTKPIKNLDIAARRLAEGEKTENIPVETDDEVGRLVRSFNYMKNKIETTEKMRRDFIANVSHDLRTPLTSINGFVSGMLDGVVKPQDYPEHLGIIKKETERLIDLTGDILELAKIQSSPSNLKIEKVNLKEVCQSVADSLKILAEEKNIKIYLDVNKNINIIADKSKLIQILSNIAGNAVKYSFENGTIEIKASEQKDSVQIEISDNGAGISKEDLPYIFEKFYRADKSRNSAGIGLGLNIAKWLVELHRGKIWADSETGKGTTVYITLPKN